jgi:hypothetical protein
LRGVAIYLNIHWITLIHWFTLIHAEILCL